jgi:hypothetical protein
MTRGFYSHPLGSSAAQKKPLAVVFPLLSDISRVPHKALI